MAYRNTMFMVSDASGAAVDVKAVADRYRDWESRVRFYEMLMSELASLKKDEEDNRDYD